MNKIIYVKNSILSSLHNFNNRKNAKKYYLFYSLIFIVMFFLIFGNFFICGRSLIRNGDAWTQHYKALVYTSQWFREIIINFLKTGILKIPTFNFSLGYGGDIITTLHYYTIGDPLNIFSILVPTKYIQYFYMFLIIFRLYLAGICFSKLCFYFKKNNYYANITGSMIYIFCGYALFASVKHPYFINPMIYFPLLIIGTEKILEDKNPILFIVMVFVSAISNFYFFYIIVFVEIIYVIWRLFTLYNIRNFKLIIKKVFSISIYAIIGVLLSAIILFPVIIYFLKDSRGSSGYIYDSLYTLKYYKSLISGFVSYSYIGSWTLLGYGGLSIVSIFLMFLNKQRNKHLLTLFIILSLFLCIPFVGSLMNGFSYVCNRWVFAYSLLVSYIFVSQWDNLVNLDFKQYFKLCIMLMIYILICVANDFSFNKNTALQIIISFFAVSLINYFKRKSYTYQKTIIEISLLSLMIFCCTCNAFFCYSYKQGNYVSEFKSFENVSKSIKNNDARAIKSINDTSFFRYGGHKVVTNEALINDLSTIQYYWSLSNGNIAKYLSEMNNFDNLFYMYNGLDERTYLNTLAGVKYYTNDTENDYYKPYGYSEIKVKSKKYKVYQNDFYLPLGYTYSSIIPNKVYNKLSATQKQEALMQGIVINKDSNFVKNTNLSFYEKEIPYKIKCDKNIMKNKNNTFYVKEKNSSITLDFEGLENCETYLSILGLNYKGLNEKELYSVKEWNNLDLYERKTINNKLKNWQEPSNFKILIKSFTNNKKITQKSLLYYTPKYKHYNNHDNFLVNLCYSNNKKTSITITFPEIGIYSFDDLGVICQPLNNYKEYVNKLKEDVIENLNMYQDIANSTDTLTCDINLDSNKILCLTIPYSDGWKAYVDGKEKEILQANTMFIGIELEKGNHHIELRYETPGLKIGLYMSLLGLFSLFGVYIVQVKIIKLKDVIKKK